MGVTESVIGWKEQGETFCASSRLGANQGEKQKSIFFGKGLTTAADTSLAMVSPAGLGSKVQSQLSCTEEGKEKTATVSVLTERIV